MFFEEGKLEIEPGEESTFFFDFVIDGRYETIVAYTYVENQAKRGTDIGWDVTSVYDIHPPS